MTTERHKTWLATAELLVTELTMTSADELVIDSPSVDLYVTDGTIAVRSSPWNRVLIANSAAQLNGPSTLTGVGRALVVKASVLEAEYGHLPAPTGAITRADADNHYGWGQGCHGWRLVERPDLSMREERMPPNTAEQTHLHNRATQFFYVLEGVCVMALPGAEYPVMPSSGLMVEPRVPHQMRNPGPGDARFLTISAPTTTGDRIEVQRSRVAAAGASTATRRPAVTQGKRT